MNISFKYYRYPLTFYNLYFHILLIICSLIIYPLDIVAIMTKLYIIFYPMVAIPVYVYNLYFNPYFVRETHWTILIKKTNLLNSVPFKKDTNRVQINHLSEFFISLILLLITIIIVILF